MRLFQKVKDGGPQSPVDAFFLFEIKGLCSIGLLRFNKGHRTAYHSHAFHALTWFLTGDMEEEDFDGSTYVYTQGILPKVTPRSKLHRVLAHRTSWAFTIRGPWQRKWIEKVRTGDAVTTTVLTHGRKIVSQDTVLQ